MPVTKALSETNMAYILAAIAGGGYSFFLKFTSEKIGIFSIVVISVTLFLLVSVFWRVENLLVSTLNSVGFFVWFCVPVLGIYLVNLKLDASLKYKNITVVVIGALCWAGFTQVSRLLGYVFGVQFT